MRIPCLPNKVYDWLKWIAIAFIPGLSMLYSVLANIWGWPFAAEVSQTANCLGSFLAILIGASSVSYSISSKTYTIESTSTVIDEDEDIATSNMITNVSSEEETSDDYSNSAPDGGQ